MRKKSFSVLFLVLVSLTALLCGCMAKQPDTTADAQAQKTITVIVVHADETEKRFTYTTAESHLDKLLLAQGLIPAGNIDKGLCTIVDGEEASWQKDQSYWALYINGQYALVGICDTLLEDGATYKLIYTQ